MNPFLCVNFHFFLSSVFHLLLFLWQSFSREDDYAMMYDAGRKRDKERETLQTAGAKNKKKGHRLHLQQVVVFFFLASEIFHLLSRWFYDFWLCQKPPKKYIYIKRKEGGGKQSYSIVHLFYRQFLQNVSRKKQLRAGIDQEIVFFLSKRTRTETQTPSSGRYWKPVQDPTLPWSMPIRRTHTHTHGLIKSWLPPSILAPRARQSSLDSQNYLDFGHEKKNPVERAITFACQHAVSLTKWRSLFLPWANSQWPLAFFHTRMWNMSTGVLT